MAHTLSIPRTVLNKPECKWDTTVENLFLWGSPFNPTAALEHSNKHFTSRLRNDITRKEKFRNLCYATCWQLTLPLFDEQRIHIHREKEEIYMEIA
jgi:hypothetical protein